ncbi:MAG: DNA-3-methyladenine glycosylase [Myxococcaceae bacterium]|nr:DNA-3-methyladenine glycosylase [Myxococcaceae bacterium]
MKSFSIEKPVGFSLQAASDFYAGFTPGSGMAAAAVDRLTLAFRLDHSFEAVAVSLREERGALIAELAGTRDEVAVHKQLSRMLGLEADAEAWLALGQRVPLVGQLQREFPGFFTAAKASPYDAAVWAIISPRLQIAQAARIKLELAEQYGTKVELHGRLHHVFPAPECLLGLERADGLSDEKVLRLRGVARAALEGLLDADHLRSLGEHAALAWLQTLRGIGPWSASHVYFRGAAPLDGLPTAEPRVLHGLAAASGSSVPSAASFQRAAESWRPFRMWVCVLLSRHLARTDGWRAQHLPRERAAAGKALAQKTRKRSRELVG